MPDGPFLLFCLVLGSVWETAGLCACLRALLWDWGALSDASASAWVRNTTKAWVWRQQGARLVGSFQHRVFCDILKQMQWKQSINITEKWQCTLCGAFLLWLIQKYLDMDSCLKATSLLSKAWKCFYSRKLQVPFLFWSISSTREHWDRSAEGLEWHRRCGMEQPYRRQLSSEYFLLDFVQFVDFYCSLLARLSFFRHCVQCMRALLAGAAGGELFCGVSCWVVPRVAASTVHAAHLVSAGLQTSLGVPAEHPCEDPVYN